jgi:hypothetical protein
VETVDKLFYEQWKSGVVQIDIVTGVYKGEKIYGYSEKYLNTDVYFNGFPIKNFNIHLESKRGIVIRIEKVMTIEHNMYNYTYSAGSKSGGGIS